MNNSTFNMLVCIGVGIFVVVGLFALYCLHVLYWKIWNSLFGKPNPTYESPDQWEEDEYEHPRLR